MIQINRDNKIKNLKNIVIDKSPSFSGIANQDCKGSLWVDNIEMPSIAVAHSYAVGGFAFLGTTLSEEGYQDLKDFLVNKLFCYLKQNGYDSFEFSIENEIMQKSLLELFQDKSIITEKEFSFRINSLPKNDFTIPKEYQIKKVDAAFWSMLLEGKYENADFIKIRLLESWHTFEDFTEKSLAYCTLLDKRIVAVMIGTANYKNVIAIDIETEESQRRMGFAYAMSVRFIEECFKCNYIPQWDCVESNPISYNMAIKLGFEKINENTVYRFNL